jgi:hypothetical protein
MLAIGMSVREGAEDVGRLSSLAQLIEAATGAFVSAALFRSTPTRS